MGSPSDSPSLSMTKIVLILLVSPLCLAAPQVSQAGFGDASPDEIAQIRAGTFLETFDDNPKYSFNYKVADDVEQTYMAMEENRDGEQVTGSYQYVDPFGSLIIVRYTAGAGGYSETREIKPSFVKIRSQPARSQLTSNAAQQQALPAPIPAPTPLRLLDAPAPPRPVTRVVPVAPAPLPAAPEANSRAAGSIVDIFGSGGDFNVRFNTPSFNIEY